MPQVFKSGWYTDSEGVRRYGIDPAQFDNPTPNQPTPPAPETPNTPANAYAGVLGSETPEEKAAREFRESQGAQYQTEANQVVNEEAIRLATEQRFQAEIDALNRVYAEKKNQERLRGQGRLGTDTAIQSRRGLIGSTFGEAQTGKVEAANVQAEEAIQDELSFELSQVRAKIRKEASDEVLAKRKAKAEGADSYMTYLTEQAERSRTKVVSAAQRLLAVASKTGTDINWGSTEIADIAKSLKISVEELKNKYEDEKATKKATDDAAKLARYKTLGKGESLIDPATGLPVYSPAVETEPLETQVVDGNLLERQADGTWKTIYAKPADKTKAPTLSEQLAMLKAGKIIDEYGNLVDDPSVLTEAEAKAKGQTQQRLAGIEKKIALIKQIQEGGGLKGAVGPNIFSRLQGTGFLNGVLKYATPLKLVDTIKEDLSGNVASTIAAVEQLIDQETLDKLMELKAAGGTLGAISEKELSILQNSATQLSNWRIKDKNGKTIGFDITEGKFKAELEKALTAANKVFDELNKELNNTIKSSGTTDEYDWERSQLQPGEILIKDKATGEVGGIPEGEFDPNLYEELSFNKDLSKSGNGSEVKKIASAIGQFESGGNYKAVGPTVTSGMYKGDKAYGKYQIMSRNLPQWSKEALGRSITLQEFLNNPQLQDRIAEYKMGKIYQQYGNVGDVASVWFSGRPVSKAGNAKDVIGTTVPKYVSSVSNIYKKLG